MLNRRSIDFDELKKLIKMTGERAKVDAKANGTYVVYKNREGKIVKEHADGEIEILDENENTEHV